LPVIVSAYDSEVIHRRAEDLGARNFLAKPVLPESLRELVNSLAGEAPAPHQAKAVPEVTDDLTGLRVLLVEDNAINQQLAQELMESRGAEVTVASNGKEALELIDAVAPDFFTAVLMDLQMPVMDGYEATRLLRLDPRFVALPIVAVSAHAMSDELERCQVLGMNGHISKPIEPELLFSTLGDIARGRNAVRPGPTSAAFASGGGPKADSPAFPAIVGLDIKSGLYHAGGRASLYKRLLERFAKDQAGFVNRIEAMVRTSAWDDAAREAHTLKGLAGSLGATALLPLAVELENALRTRDATLAMKRLVGVDEHLAPLIDALRPNSRIERRVRPRGDGDADRAFTRTEVDFSRLDSWIDHFRALLARSDIEAKALWETHRAEALAAMPLQSVQRISVALDQFDFDLASRLVSNASTDSVIDPAFEGRG
jgi:two-component system sensor histidine kinase/response regulator